ncbi:hypothetical protein QL285_073908 [Trifolium repens]|nr:hypothetical protein QL285_073908 [Trifolium repens]
MATMLDYGVGVQNYQGRHIRLRHWRAKLSSPSCEHKGITNDSFKKSSGESKRNAQIISPKKQREVNANVLRHASKKKKKRCEPINAIEGYGDLMKGQKPINSMKCCGDLMKGHNQ